MKSLLFIFIFLFSTDSVVTAQIAVGSYAPNFTLIKRDGNVINFSDLKGKTLFVSFWATWCGPCRTLELPKLQELYKKFHSNNNFLMCTIAVGETYNKIYNFNLLRGYDLPFIADESMTVFNSFYGQAIPYSVIINQYGIISYVSTGYSEWEFNNMVNTLNTLLN